MKLLRITLAVLLMSCCTTISAFDFCADGIYYNILSDTEVEVTDGDERYSGDITIPENVTYDNVTYSVTTIGSWAFYDCTELTSIKIPNSITTIGSYAFGGCTGLTSIVVAEGNTKYDSREECNAIIETASNTLIVGCKNSVIPNSVTAIGNYAFYNCRGLTIIEIPNSVTTIGNNPFQNCTGLTSIVVAEGNTKYDSREECNAIIVTESNTLIAGCKNSVIPNSVTTIGESAFNGCTSLTSIEIPNSVTTIGESAFNGCTSLTSIEIPNSVTTIGNYAFYICSGLTSIEIPNSVTTIGRSAFEYCTGLKSIEIPNSVTTIGNYAFYYCSGLTNIEIPNSVTTIGRCAFEYCTGLKSIEIPNSVTTIGDYAFSGCTGLINITIGNSVTTIGNYAFSGCTGLTSITSLIPAEKLFVPGYGAFNSCNNSNCILYVPAGAKETYAATEGWNEFTNIVELEDTNIDKVVSPDNSLYFDLNGRGVENPTRGIYIVNGKKIIVK